MLCAMSSSSSNLIVASAVSIAIVPRRGVVDIVDTKTPVILCASSIEQFLAFALAPKCAAVVRSFIEPDQRFARFETNESFFHVLRVHAVRQVENESVVCVPEQCLPGLTGCEGLDIDECNLSRMKLSACGITNLAKGCGRCCNRLFWNNGASSDFPFRDELDANFRSVDPNQFASSECEPGRGQNQEELMRLQNFQRPVDRESGAGRGNIDENAASPPRAIDAHEIDGTPVFEANAFCFSTSPCHQFALAAAKSLSVKPGFTSSRTDPNRIVRCATDRERDFE